jgi:hypothetical protein
MMLLLMAILNFWILSRWCPGLVAGRACYRRSIGPIQGNRIVWFGKLDDPVFTTPETGLAISVFSHEDVEGGFWMRSWFASLVLLPSANFWIFGPDHPRLSLLSYDDLFALDRLGLRRLNQDLISIELDRIHVSWEQIFVELHLGLSTNFNRPSLMADWTCRWKTLQSLVAWE